MSHNIVPHRNDIMSQCNIVENFQIMLFPYLFSSGEQMNTLKIINENSTSKAEASRLHQPNGLCLMRKSPSGYDKEGAPWQNRTLSSERDEKRSNTFYSILHSG